MHAASGHAWGNFFEAMSSGSGFFGRISLWSMLLGVVIGLGLSWVFQSLGDSDPSAKGADNKLQSTASGGQVYVDLQKQSDRSTGAGVGHSENGVTAKSQADFIRDLNERFEQALLSPVGMSRSDTLLSLVSEMCRYSPKLAFEKFLPELDGIDAHNALAEIAVSWAEQDPLGALEGAKTLGDPEATAAVAELALFRLAQSDPTDALGRMDEFKTLLEAERFNNLQNGFIAGWAMTNPQEAIAYVNKMVVDSPEVKKNFMTTVVGNAAIKDPLTTLNAVHKNLTGASLEEALKVTYSAWATTDPAAAAKSVEKMSPGPTADELVVNIAREWSQYQPDMTIEWVKAAANISEPAKNELMENLNSRFNETPVGDPEAQMIEE